MSALDCAAVREAASEFALGVLDGETRADVVAHLERCGSCRTTVADLTDTADAMVLLAPEAEPPAGFERRVVAALDGGGRRRRWRTVRVVAIAAAAAAILSVVTVRIVDNTRDEPVAAPATSVLPMVGADGTTVGEVAVTDAGRGATVDLAVDYALPDGEYRVVLQPAAGGDEEDLGVLTVAGGRGRWVGAARAGDAGATLVLVDGSGRVQCTAALPPA